jgi:D-alanyl-D-alanine carboxypeptidase (penicillin-binding protein 5/6)
VVNDIYVTIPRGRYKDLDASLAIDTRITAPLASGQELGQLNVKLDGEDVVNQALVAMQAVADGGIVQKLVDRVKLIFE